MPEDAEAKKKADAKVLYDKGNNHYNLGEFKEAIADFKGAYALTSAPGLLFNIAQSYRLLKDYENALRFYQNYLRLKPDAGNRADVEKRIVEMEGFIEEAKKNAQSKPSDTIPPDGEVKPPIVPTVVEVKPDDKPVITGPVDGPPSGSGKSMKVAGLATAGAGVALVLTGVIFGSMASSAEADLNALSPNMGTWTAAEQDKYDSGKRNNTIMIVSYIAGGAAIITGGALYMLGRKKDTKSTVAVVPTRTGATFAVGWSF